MKASPTDARILFFPNCFDHFAGTQEEFEKYYDDVLEMVGEHLENNPDSNHQVLVTNPEEFYDVEKDLENGLSYDQIVQKRLEEITAKRKLIIN